MLYAYKILSKLQGLMHVNGRPVAAFDPEGLIFGAGIDAEFVKLYDLRSFDRVIRHLVTCEETRKDLIIHLFYY